MTKKLIITFLVCVSAFGAAHAQKVSVKTNALYWATFGTPNLAFELGLGPKTTLDIAGGYNWFTYKDDKKFKHALVQPELRHWFCERFSGTFFGIHLHGGIFNVNQIGPFTKLEENRYEGYFYGAGVGIGHQWILSNRWALETELGVGYARVEYDKFGCEKCAPKTDSGHYNYFGPTRTSLSFVYYLW